MNQLTREITREYRLDFNTGEAHWDDPIPPDVTSDLLGKPTICIIDRTSLLAWWLMMNVREVSVADVTAGGWMKITVSTGCHFDEARFAREVDHTVASVTQVPSNLAQKPRSHHAQQYRENFSSVGPHLAASNLSCRNTL